jgi:TctA family transporter
MKDQNSSDVKFKNKLWIYRLTNFIIFGVGGLLGYSVFEKNLRIFLVSIALLALYFAVNLLFWKCPACNKTLPMLVPVRKIEQCKKCGVKLVDK